jgi:hypothetical protein
MSELSQHTKNLIQKYLSRYQALQEKSGGSTVHVDEVASKVASFYEKMRGIIDWREEHLLRKTAIERILKRRLFLKRNGEQIAEPLVQELIRGGHFPNDAIPEEKINRVQKLINKYIFIIDNAPPPPKEKVKLQLYDWILGIAACEVEETLSPPIKETALIEFMLENMAERIEVRGIEINQEEKITQLYIAIQRALFKLDPPLISYHLLNKWYSNWSELSQSQLEEIASNIYSIWEKIEKNLKHPLAEKFYNVCERYDTPYLILGDIISGDPQNAQKNLENPALSEGKIREAYSERLKKSKRRMHRAAIYSTLSIFLTKILVAFAIEVPFDQYVTGQFSYFNLGLNILIPSSLMFFLVLSIRPPSKQNEELVVMEVMKIVYEREKKDVYEIRPTPKRGLVLNAIIVIFYLLSFVASFGLIIWGLQKLNFSILSILIFLMFISLISFAGVKIRQRVKELVVEREKEGFLRTFIDLFSLPIIQVGRWLSNQWTKYNAIAVLFNSLLDMPFQVFVEFLEQWRAFLKEKKEKIH